MSPLGQEVTRRRFSVSGVPDLAPGERSQERARKLASEKKLATGAGSQELPCCTQILGVRAFTGCGVNGILTVSH